MLVSVSVKPYINVPLNLVMTNNDQPQGKCANLRDN